MIVARIPEPLVDEILEDFKREYIKTGSALHQLLAALEAEREWQKKQTNEEPGNRLSLEPEQNTSAG